MQERKELYFRLTAIATAQHHAQPLHLQNAHVSNILAKVLGTIEGDKAAQKC
jgi:hypothetical protein